MMFLIILTAVIFIFFSISLVNLISAPVLKVSQDDCSAPELISVLIPARNEEKNIKNCLDSILKQDYPRLEIIVLDDSSTDRTPDIAKSFSNRGVRVISGKTLPEGWIGKNWACHQLSQEARGSLMLFLDADVYLEYGTIKSAFNEIVKYKLALLSVFPTQILGSLGEYLIVPLMNWILLNFLPLKSVYSFRSDSLTAANGQFMLWDRKSYIAAGGHNLVFDKVVEDMELAREVKRQGMKVKTFLGGELIFCRMYSTTEQAIKGFSKNFYAGFNIHPMLFLIIISLLLIIFTYPFFIINKSSYALLPVSLILLSRIFISIKSRQNLLLNILLHPLQMLMMFLIGINSAIRKELKLLEWKDRKI